MGEVTELNAAKGDLLTKLSALSTRIFAGCNAIGQDGCNQYVTVEDANLIQQAWIELRKQQGRQS